MCIDENYHKNIQIINRKKTHKQKKILTHWAMNMENKYINYGFLYNPV